jgi:hypothetical protein
MTPDVFVDADGNRFAVRCTCPLHRTWPKKGHDARPLRDETGPAQAGPDNNALTITATSATPETT